MSSSNQYTPPGRIGNPNMTPRDDPRFNPKLLEVMATFGLDAISPQSPVSSASSLERLTEHMSVASEQIAALYGALPVEFSDKESEPKVERSDLSIDGPDGNTIKLHVFRRADLHDKTLPCVVYTHGGGMVYIDTINPVHIRWLKSLALAGVAAIAVDFRNAWTKEKRNAFPAGLNDCAAGVQYIASHKAELKISKIVIQGESGGGNLAIATTLKANREGWVSSIDGVYACCPYISNAWNWPEDKKLKELPSLVENDGYFINVSGMDGMAAYYTYKEHTTDPLAWPYHASNDDLKDLPPVIVHVDELDPLRDEGIAFYRKLLNAGVEADAKMNIGVTHGAPMFGAGLPLLHKYVTQSIAGFAENL